MLQRVVCSGRRLGVPLCVRSSCAARSEIICGAGCELLCRGQLCRSLTGSLARALRGSELLGRCQGGRSLTGGLAGVLRCGGRTFLVGVVRASYEAHAVVVGITIHAWAMLVHNSHKI